MPELAWQARAQGGWAAKHGDPHDGGPCDCDWSAPGGTAAEMVHRVLPMPDQSRYGSATTDPLGREGPGWTKGRNGLPARTKGDDDDA